MKTPSNYYISRTNAYYADDDDYVFTPDYWTVGESNDSDFAPEFCPLQLTQEGYDFYEEWAHDMSCGYDLCCGRAKGLAAQYSRDQMFHLLCTSDEYCMTPVKENELW